MLEFFRKYQRYFFIFITIVIVISFSFFGTYNTLPRNDAGDVAAFRAVDGTVVSRSDLDEMVMFLSSDMEDKLYFGGAWGPNFLNSGAIKKLLLQPGVAELLAEQYSADLSPDMQKRFEAEKRYSAYVHPQAKFISAESIWANWAPNMLTDLKTLQRADDPSSPEAFAARVRLYLAEKNFPSPYLQHILRNQEKQYPWISPDENLGHMDLSLFGYHTLNDWFGPRFMSLAAEFIYNSAKVAEQRGYRVSKSEAQADLLANAALSFQQNLRSSQLGVANTQEYFNEQLRRMGMDQTKAVKIWQNVLLAQRLFEEAGNSVFVSPFMFDSFIAYSKEPVKGELYQLPKELKLGDYRALQKFEIYLDAVSARSDKDKTSLALPEKFLSASQIAKKAPELVQKRYTLEMTQLDKNDLLPKILVIDTLEWEVSDQNWSTLQKKFPDLGIESARGRQERLAALDKLNEKSRAKIDEFARREILAARPELINRTLETKPSSTLTVGLSLKGPAAAPFKGVEDATKLMALLNNAPLENKQPSSNAEAEASQQLQAFSVDGRHYYKINVIERLPNEEVLTFAQANSQGILDRLLDQKLKSYYEGLKGKLADGKPFQKSDGSWKEYADVKDLVADKYFASVLKAIQEQSNEKTKLTGDQAAPRRLLPYVKMVEKELQENPQASERFVRAGQMKDNGDILADQWKLESRPFKIERSHSSEQINSVEALEMAINSWSPVAQSPTGAISFYQKLPNDQKDHSQLALEKSTQSKRYLASEAQRLVAEQLIAEFKAKQALSLSFMQSGEEMIGSDG